VALVLASRWLAWSLEQAPQFWAQIEIRTATSGGSSQPASLTSQLEFYWFFVTEPVDRDKTFLRPVALSFQP
jgi:hypothetical protein